MVRWRYQLPLSAQIRSHKVQMTLVHLQGGG
jgi:hypothetical protein